MKPGPDGFPGCLLIWRDILRSELWLIWGGSVRMTCPEHYAGGGWEPERCKDCPYEEKCK